MRIRMQSRRADARLLFPNSDRYASPPVFLLSGFFIAVLGPWIFQLDQDFSADTLLRANDELSAHPINPFLHANQSKAIILLRRIKAAPVVHKSKLNFI